jgi:hypothetical protein
LTSREDSLAKIKGTAMLNGAQKDAARALLPPRLHGYLVKRILVSDWYPEEDQLELLHVLKKLLPDPGTDPWEFMGRYVAQRDLSGVYSSMIRPGDPAATLKRGTGIWKIYHDTGSLQITLDGNDAARFDLVDFGLPSVEMCGVLRGWYAQLLSMAGAQEVTLKDSLCAARGDELCRWEAGWKAPEPF